MPSNICFAMHLTNVGGTARSIRGTNLSLMLCARRCLASVATANLFSLTHRCVSDSKFSPRGSKVCEGEAKPIDDQ